MKNFVLLILVFAPVLSFSNCPVINQEYRCDNGDKFFKRTVTTNFENGVYSYNIADNGQERFNLVTDNTLRPFELNEDDFLVVGKLRSRCDRNNLYAEFNGSLDGDDGEVKLNMKATKGNRGLSISYDVYYNDMLFQEMNEDCNPV